MIYPDSDDTTSLGDGTDGTYDRVEYKFNRLGQTTWTKDQNGTIHQYEFGPPGGRPTACGWLRLAEPIKRAEAARLCLPDSGIGRQTVDKVTTFGTNIDQSVQRIDRDYEVRGMVSTVTSYSDTSGTTAVNQILREYTDFGLLEKEYQEGVDLTIATSVGRWSFP